MQRQFRHVYTVRYDECDAYGFLTPAAFLRYMQDIAGLDAEDLHFTGDGFWIVKRTVISFAAAIPLHTQLAITTYGMGFTRITAQRGYDAHLVSDPDGEPVVKARTLWVYVDKRGRPMRMPENTVSLWLPDGPVAQLSDAAFAAVPERLPERTTTTVRFSDIDYMQHLNNAAAVELLDNAAWKSYVTADMLPTNVGMSARTYDIEYIASIPFGESVEIETWFEPFPIVDEEFSRIQQIVHGGRVAVRADSRWLCRTTQ
jgi:Predicted thioesterase